MAATIKLKQGDSGTILNLNAGYSDGNAALGWNVEAWNVQEAEYLEGGKPQLVTETMDLLLRGEDHDDLATRKQSLHQMQVYAERYIKDRNFITPVWLHVQTSGETNERRALVHSMNLTPRSPSLDIKGWIDQSVERYRIQIVRGPYWEATTPITALTTNSISTIGGEWDFSSGGNTIVGDVPARLYKLTVKGHTDVVVLEKVWVGFRSDDRHSDLANFPSVWEMEDGYASSTDTTSSVDSDASGDAKMVCDFSSETDWYPRVNFLLDDVTTNMESAYGRFVVLLRAKVSDASTEVWTYLQHRLIYDPHSIINHEIIEVEDDSWTMYPLGVVTIPIRNLQGITTTLVSDTYDSGEVFLVQCKRQSGTGNIELDCLIFVPVDEYFLYLENAGVETSRKAYATQSPKNEHCAITVGASQATAMPQLQVIGNGVPTGNTRLYITTDDITDDRDTVAFELQVVNRWLSLRGSE